MTNVSLHNVAEAVPMDDGGVRLQRVPEAVREHLGEHARERMLDPAGVEVRFVVEPDGEAAVRLHSLGGPVDAFLFCGEVSRGRLGTVGPDAAGLRVSVPAWFSETDRAALGRTPFDHRVCRLLLTGGAVCLHGVDGPVRPPRPDEVPSQCLLGYGTSITQGAGSSVRHMCFLAQTARRLGMDCLNLGCASAAVCEPQLADYLARRDDWHVATFEPTANMLHLPLDEFRERTRYFLDALAGPDASRPVVCITLMAMGADGKGDGKTDAYRAALHEVAESVGLTNVHVVKGTDLLDELRDLTGGLIHPSDHGHTFIAERLARRIRAFRGDAS